MEKIRLTVEELPELDTEVAISGSVKQQEVGGWRLHRRRSAGSHIYISLLTLERSIAARRAGRHGPAAGFDPRNLRHELQAPPRRSSPLSQSPRKSSSAPAVAACLACLGIRQR